MKPPLRYCGQCQICSVLDYAGIQVDHYKTVSPSTRSRYSGYMRPDSYACLQKKYGFNVQIIRKTKGSYDERLNWLKETVRTSQFPIIVLVGHGYSHHNEIGLQHNKLLKMVMQPHYISIRGYDDETEQFHVYDSSIAPAAGDGIVNVTFPYRNLMRYRGRGVLGLYNYVAIHISQ